MTVDFGFYFPEKTPGFAGGLAEFDSAIVYLVLSKSKSLSKSKRIGIGLCGSDFDFDFEPDD
jgi:hypothetical protein